MDHHPAAVERNGRIFENGQKRRLPSSNGDGLVAIFGLKCQADEEGNVTAAVA